MSVQSPLGRRKVQTPPHQWLPEHSQEAGADQEGSEACGCILSRAEVRKPAPQPQRPGQNRLVGEGYRLTQAESEPGTEATGCSVPMISKSWACQMLVLETSRSASLPPKETSASPVGPGWGLKSHPFVHQPIRSSLPPVHLM